MGQLVCRYVEGCLRRDANMFPANSAMLNAPRAIARVTCWNPDRMHDPVFYGVKLAFTCVYVEEILPYPSTWGVGIAVGAVRVLLLLPPSQHLPSPLPSPQVESS